MTRRLLFICLGALSFFASQVQAQRYNIKKQPDELDEFSVGAAFMSPCDVQMRNLGNVYQYYNEAGVYNDFGIGKDYSYDTLKDGKTYRFMYLDVSQLCDINGVFNPIGGYIKATAVKAVSTTGPFDKDCDSGLTLGMEVIYTHYFDKKHKFGLMVGFANNGFTIKKNAEWDANLYTRSDIYKYYGLDTMDGFTGSITRPHVFSTDEPEVYVYLEPVSTTEQQLFNDDGTAVTTTVDSEWQLKASYMTLRLGGVYNFRLSRHLLLRASGGFAFVSASSRFRWDETYSVVDDNGAPLHDDLTSISGDDYNEIEDVGTTVKHKFLLGGWGELGAHYRVNRKLTVYSSLGYQSTNSLHYKSVQGCIIDLDSSNIYSVKTGFSWAF